uniref:Major head subunit n=1 Tax=uncultured marine virus TaxID=186617 RepID=A0A0F7L599_9VIRU|nr:major head subunit [uncultured marine virus]
MLALQDERLRVRVASEAVELGGRRQSRVDDWPHVHEKILAERVRSAGDGERVIHRTERRGHHVGRNHNDERSSSTVERLAYVVFEPVHLRDHAENDVNHLFAGRTCRRRHVERGERARDQRIVLRARRAGTMRRREVVLRVVAGPVRRDERREQFLPVLARPLREVADAPL